jgi:hypothetical protein
MTKEFEMTEIGVEEGAPKLKILYFPMWCYRGGTLHHSMSCKWALSLAYSTWVIC